MKNIQFLHPSTFKLDGGAMFGIIPKPLWEKKIAADERNRIHMALRVPFLQSSQRKVLIDTGIGFSNPDKFNQIFAVNSQYESFDQLLQQEAGCRAEDITDVILTHLHFDHVGGLCENIQQVLQEKAKPICTFKNARLHLHQKHYEYSLKPSARDAGSFHSHIYHEIIQEAQKQNIVQFLNQEDGVILQDEDLKIHFKISHGHTPHMIHPIINDEFIYMADLIPTHAHLPVPWVMGYDINPGITCEYKDKFLKLAKEKNLTLIYEHDLQYVGSDFNQEKDTWINRLNQSVESI